MTEIMLDPDMRENQGWLDPEQAVRRQHDLPVRPPAGVTHDSLLKRIRSKLGAWVRRIRTRRELRELAEHERLLRDVGLCREEALREANRPFWRR